jgi:hypothetical protein
MPAPTWAAKTVLFLSSIYKDAPSQAFNNFSENKLDAKIMG